MLIYCTRILLPWFILMLPFLVAGQECVPKANRHSDFEVLKNGDLLIVGNPGVSSALTDASNKDKQLQCHVFIFNVEGEKVFDEQVDYRYPGDYYAFQDTAGKYNCRSNEVIQVDIYPRGPKGAFILGAFLGHQDLEHKIVLDRKHNPSEHIWTGGPPLPNLDWTDYKEMLNRSRKKKYDEAHYTREWSFTDTEGACSAGPFTIDRKKDRSVLQFREDGQIQWTVSLNGYIDCDNPFSTRKIIAYGGAYYISVINDHAFRHCPDQGADHIPILYKLSEEGEVLWEIRYDELVTDQTTTRNVVLNREKADVDHGRYDMRRVKKFRDAPVDSMVTYFHENGKLHYRVQWKDNRLTDNKVKYYSPKGELNTEEVYRADGTLAVRTQYYSRDRVKSRSYFGEDGTLQRKMIHENIGRSLELQIFEGDTCVKRVLTDNSGASRVVVLDKKEGKTYYRPQMHQLYIDLGRHLDPQPHVLVYPDEFSDPIEAIYDEGKGLYVVQLIPPKIIKRISIISDDLVPEEVWDIPLSIYREEFMTIGITTAPKGWDSYYAGQQLHYYKPVDLRLGILIRGVDGFFTYRTRADSIVKSLSDLNIEEDSSVFGPVWSRVPRERQDSLQREQKKREIPAIVLRGPFDELKKAARRMEGDAEVIMGWVTVADQRKMHVIRKEIRVVFNPGVDEETVRAALSRQGFETPEIKETKIQSWKYDHRGQLKGDEISVYMVEVKPDWKRPEELRSIAEGFNEESSVMHVAQQTANLLNHFRGPWE